MEVIQHSIAALYHSCLTEHLLAKTSPYELDVQQHPAPLANSHSLFIARCRVLKGSPLLQACSQTGRQMREQALKAEENSTQDSSQFSTQSQSHGRANIVQDSLQSPVVELELNLFASVRIQHILTYFDRNIPFHSSRWTQCIMRQYLCVPCGFFYTAIFCPKLHPPLNGIVRVRDKSVDSRAMYECLAGYVVFGDEYRTCQSDGEWSGEEPECRCE